MGSSTMRTVAIWLAAFSWGVAQAQGPLELGDIMQLEWASDPQISPDGRHIA